MAKRPRRDLEPTGPFYTREHAFEAPGLIRPTIWSRGMKPTARTGGGRTRGKISAELGSVYMYDLKTTHIWVGTLIRRTS